MNSKKPISKKLSLDELIVGALKQLEKLNYDGRSIRRYQSTWRRLIAFAHQHKFKNELSEKLVIQFLEGCNITPGELAASQKGWRKHTAFSIKILWHFARFGYFERIHTLTQRLNIPIAMKKMLSEYEKYCREKRYLSPFTIDECTRQISLFLDFLSSKNIHTFNQMREVDLSEFVQSLWRYSAKTISSIVSYIRLFLQFLFLRNVLKKDISQALPRIRVTHHSKIPSVWDRELVAQLLDAVDRSSPRGKRDYAMLLLACRLGLRLSDIRQLTLDQIDWESATISIIQSKTKAPLSLPLTHEVGNALIDYLSSARAKTSYREVFLRLRPPFIPFNRNTHLRKRAKNTCRADYTSLPIKF